MEASRGSLLQVKWYRKVEGLEEVEEGGGGRRQRARKEGGK